MSTTDRDGDIMTTDILIFQTRKGKRLGCLVASVHYQEPGPPSHYIHTYTHMHGPVQATCHYCSLEKSRLSKLKN